MFRKIAYSVIFVFASMQSNNAHALCSPWSTGCDNSKPAASNSPNPASPNYYQETYHPNDQPQQLAPNYNNLQYNPNYNPQQYPQATQQQPSSQANELCSPWNPNCNAGHQVSQDSPEYVQPTINANEYDGGGHPDAKAIIQQYMNNDGPEDNSSAWKEPKYRNSK